MTQMRKFEQEAIATEIYEKIKATNSVVQKELEQTKKYKDIQAVVDELSELSNQIIFLTFDLISERYSNRVLLFFVFIFFLSIIF